MNLPKPKKDPRSLTKLEQERQKIRLRGETEELVDELGHEDEKRGKKAAEEYIKAQDEAEAQKKAEDLEILKGFSNNRQMYQRYLLIILRRFISQERLSNKYRFYAESTDKGIVLGIEGTEFVGAFETIGVPFYDANACKIMVIRLANTVMKLEGHIAKTKNGILLGDGDDLKFLAKGKLKNG